MPLPQQSGMSCVLADDCPPASQCAPTASLPAVPGPVA
jgi:hypothetical protein